MTMKRIISDKMEPLYSWWNKLAEEGYQEASVVSSHRLRFKGSDVAYSPSEIKIMNFYRYEGMSDPEDNSILYVMEASDGHKGMLLDGYGIYADNAVSLFMGSVEEIKKEVPGEQPAND